MNLDQIIAVYDRLLGGTLEDPLILDEMTTIAEDGLVMVDRRITRQGLSANGKPLGPYSPGYLAHKKAAGKYRGIVDLTFTGEMWRNIKIVGKFQSGTMTTIRVGASDAVTQAKMENNADLRGDFMDLSAEELAILIADSQERWFGNLNRYFEQ